MSGVAADRLGRAPGHLLAATSIIAVDFGTKMRSSAPSSADSRAVHRPLCQHRTGLGITGQDVSEYSTWPASYDLRKIHGE